MISGTTVRYHCIQLSQIKVRSLVDLVVGGNDRWNSVFCSKALFSSCISSKKFSVVLCLLSKRPEAPIILLCSPWKIKLKKNTIFTENSVGTQKRQKGTHIHPFPTEVTLRRLHRVIERFIIQRARSN